MSCLAFSHSFYVIRNNLPRNFFHLVVFTTEEITMSCFYWTRSGASVNCLLLRLYSSYFRLQEMAKSITNTYIWWDFILWLLQLKIKRFFHIMLRNTRGKAILAFFFQVEQATIFENYLMCRHTCDTYFNCPLWRFLATIPTVTSSQRLAISGRLSPKIF